jgi:hypothetical protein
MATMSAFKVDPYVPDLAAGRRPATWGLNLNLASPPPEELRAPYEALAHQLTKELEVCLRRAATGLELDAPVTLVQHATNKHT